jgi:hypothetical protein
MPTVPRQFVPQATPQGGGDIGEFAAPDIRPVENPAAIQQIRFGEAMTSAGDQVFRLGSAIQDTINDAATRQADVKALGSFNEIASEYLNTSGVDAESKYGEAISRMSQAAQAAMDGLQNDTQRSMLSNIVSRNMMQFQSRFAEHRIRELKVWDAREAEARSAQYERHAADSYNDTPEGRAEFGISLEIAKQEANRFLDLKGVPADSAIRANAIADLTSRVTRSIAGRLMNEKKFDEAIAMIREQDMPKEVKSDLITRIESVQMRDTATTYAENLLNYGALTPPQNGAISLGVETLADGLELIDKIKDDDLRRLTTTEFRQQYAAREQVRRDSANRNYETVVRAMNAGRPVSDLMLASLDPRDRAHVMKQVSEEADERVRVEVAIDPTLLTESWVMANRDRMSTSTFIRLLDDARNPERVIEATVNARQLSAILYNSDLPKLADPDSRRPEQVQQRLLLDASIQQAIDMEQKQRGRKLNMDESRQIMERVVLQQVYEERFGKDPTRIYATMTREEKKNAYVTVGGQPIYMRDIGEQTIREIEQDLIGVDIPPTMQNIAKAFLDYSRSSRSGR